MSAELSRHRARSSAIHSVLIAATSKSRHLPGSPPNVGD
jgi:hypothetical protein